MIHIYNDMVEANKVRGHVKMTSVRGGGEGVAKKLTESDGEGGGKN